MIAPSAWQPCRANLTYILWGLAFGLATRGALWLLSQQALALPIRIAVVLVPLIPAVLCLAGFVRWLDGLGELQRRIQLEALAFVFPGTLLLAVTVELLQAAGFLGSLHWNFRSLGFAMLASLVIGYFWSLRRYR